MNWLEPWQATEGMERRRLYQQLQFELIPGHLLHGISIDVIGRSLANDDILVKLQHPKYQFAVVHLTWQSGKFGEWPSTKFYLDQNDFVENKMNVDSYNY